MKLWNTEFMNDFVRNNSISDDENDGYTNNTNINWGSLPTMMISTNTDSTFIKFVIYNVQFGTSFWFHISSMILLLCLN